MSNIEPVSSEDLLLTVLRVATAVMIVDPATDKIVASNSTAGSTFGYPELSGRRFSELHPQSVASLIVFADEVAYRGKGWTRELVGRHESGSDIALEYEATRLEHKGKLLLSFCAFDLSERAKRDTVRDAQAASRDSTMELRRLQALHLMEKHLHQQILDSAGEGIYGLDSQGFTTFVNPAAERMLGWTAADLVGRDMHSLVHHKHADGSFYPIEDCPINNAIKNRETYSVEDECFWRKDGKPMRVEYTSTPILDQGEVLGAVIVFRDITEQKEKDRRLRAALAEVDQLKERLELENSYLQEEILEQRNHHQIIGVSRSTDLTLKQIELVAPTDSNVLITGESGTGKELVAQAIHRDSDRAHRPLIRVNCAAIPGKQFETEFFGHVRGAFEGAVNDRVGRFELADGGTIFLDEVGEIPLELQAKLLRVLQDRKIERVGEGVARKVDVRIIAATNRNLERELEKGNFREDLYFRLSVFPIALKPLRERPEDITPLARHFLRICARRLNISKPRLSQANLVDLTSYNWPGNARELENVVERAVILSRRGKLHFNLPKPPLDEDTKNQTKEAVTIETEIERRHREAQGIKAALEISRGKVSGPGGAAELLGVKPTTLFSRIQRLGIKKRP